MNTPPASTLGSRLLAGVGMLALLAAVGLFASRPAHTAGGPVPVSITNTPLPTLPTDMAAPTQPFQYTFQPQSETFDFAGETITVPAHKRLVIEYVSASLIEYTPGVGGYVQLVTTAGGQRAYYYLTDIVQDYNKRSQTVRIYADPGTTVEVRVATDQGNTTGIGADTEISGYYVNVP